MDRKEEMFSNNQQRVKSQRIIHTPSEFARSSLFYLQETGEMQVLEPHQSYRRGLDSYLFFIIESGSGVLRYEDMDYPLSANDCVFIDCRKPYMHSSDADLWKLRWVHFDGNAMKRVYQRYTEGGGKPYFSPEQSMRYHEILRDIYTEASAASYTQGIRIHEKLSSLLVMLMEDSLQSEMNGNRAGKSLEIEKVKAYLDTNYIQKITLDDLSERFFINKFYMLDLFKRRYGKTVLDYLIQVRITHGKHMLRFTDMTVEDIAYACGMNSVQYFSRIFKKVEGITPSQFRQVWGK